MGFEARRPQDGRHRRQLPLPSGCWRLASTKSSEGEDDGKHSEGRHDGSPLARVSVRGADRRAAGKQVQAISLTRARDPLVSVEKGP